MGARAPGMEQLVVCLEQFRQTAGGIELASAELQEFMGAPLLTAKRIAQGRLPRGQNLVKLMYFLEHKGYKVEAIERLDPVVADLGRLVAFGIAEPVYVNDTLGYAKREDDGVQQLWELLRGGRTLTGEKQEMAALIIEEFQDKLDKRRTGTQDQAAPATAQTLAGRHVAAARTESIVPILAHLVQAAYPLAKQLESDDYTDEDRETLRQLVGEEEYFFFANIVNRLGGPRARALIRGKEFDRG